MEGNGPMYKSLLVAIDHSEITERVLGAASELASLSNGEVWVLHLREREVMPRAGLVASESTDEARASVDWGTLPARLSMTPGNETPTSSSWGQGDAVTWPGSCSAAPRTR